MASDASYLEFIREQAELGERLGYRKMFGEYALYLDSKVVALVCDNQLFLKPTAAGRALLGSAATEAPAYPGSKPYLLLGGELDDRALLQRLLQATADALPLPPPKKPAKPRAKKLKP